MSELQALLFDVDGTLADTEEIHRQSFNEAFAAAGLDWDWSPRRYGELLAVTGGKERIRHYLENEGIPLAPPQGLDAFIAELHQAKTEYYTRTVGTGGMPLRPGVKRLLLEARQAGLRLGIATTTTPENVTALLVNSLAADSCDWFEVIAAGGVVPRKKPDPGIYAYAIPWNPRCVDPCSAGACIVPGFVGAGSAREVLARRFAGRARSYGGARRFEKRGQTPFSVPFFPRQFMNSPG
ncbi:MAG: HAD hydrolase-like protein [Xanthomonadaceae bacterium]|nr:HAD hydrolase-like protein [Xanthomonadaceae bacterium]